MEKTGFVCVRQIEHAGPPHVPCERQIEHAGPPHVLCERTAGN